MWFVAPTAWKELCDRDRKPRDYFAPFFDLGSRPMTVSIVVPIFWKDAASPCVRGVLEIDASDLHGCELQNVTVKALKELLNEKLEMLSPWNSTTIRQVAKILFYGDVLMEYRTLGALIPEMASAAPRLVVTTRKERRRKSGMSIVIKMPSGEKMSVNCVPDDTVRNLKKKIMKVEDIPVDEQRLIFGGKNLVDCSTLDAINIQQQSVLYLATSFDGGSCTSQPFANVSDDSILMLHDFSPTAPTWRIVSKGLNIEGRCTNPGCRAFKHMVIHRLRFNSFNLMQDTHVYCPKCYWPFKPLTCGFYDCVWKFDGIHTGNRMQLSSPWREAFGEKYHRFNADESHGSVSWDSLLILAKPREMKAMVHLTKQVCRDKDEYLSSCMICWFPFASIGGQDCATTTCGHRFHGGCMNEWAVWSRDNHGYTSCPMCRKVL